jgi:hypothetical protein
VEASCWKKGDPTLKQTSIVKAPPSGLLEAYCLVSINLSGSLSE